MRKSLSILLAAMLSSAAFAQEFRATLTGRVTDQSGAVVPKAHVTVTNMETGVKTNTVSDKAGVYTVPFLLPGKYSIAVAAPGFSAFVHDNVTLLTSAKVEEDAELKVGSETQEVHVTADNTMIETSTATMGQVLTSEEIEDLPDNGRSPLGLAKTEEGVVPKAKNTLAQARPFDNSAVSDFSMGGGNSQSNEYLLNGVPNNQDSSRVPGFSPALDSVQSIRADVFESDASYGDTSGGTVNITTKAGTNTLHGALSWFNEFSAINAPQRWFEPSNYKVPVTRQNQPSVALGGPVYIPKIYNGRDHLFFFYAYERFKDSVPNPVTTTVPTAAERSGDFSALLAQNSLNQLYDPFSGVMVGNKIVRKAFSGNIIPSSRFNPIAQALLQYFPQPNVTGLADGENNFFSNVPTRDDYNSHLGRLDYSFNDSNKLYFSTQRSEWYRVLSNVFNNLATGTTTYIVNQGGILDYIHTFSATATLDTRLSLTRNYTDNSLNSLGFDVTKVGYPSYLATNATEHVMPRIAFSETAGTIAYAGLSTTVSPRSAFDTFQIFAALTKVAGHHTLKIGPDLRQEKYAKVIPSNYSPSGNFTFGGTFMNAGSGASTIPFGSSFASFLLGVPTSGSQQIATPNMYNARYLAGFLQDDWRVMPSLTLNLGLRLEHETPITESRNNAVVGFDPTIVNSAAAGATAKYASSYSATYTPELPVSAFNPNGGLIYATSSRRNEYNTAPLYVSPRFGFSFAPPAMHGKTVVRGGLGIFVNPFNDYNTPQTYGFSTTTAYVASTNNNLTPATTLSDPFPALNPIQQPTGNALGVNTNLGQGIVFRSANVKVPYAERWSLDVQQQLTRNLMMDVGYIGSHQVHLSYSNAVSSAPLLPYLSRSRRADPANTAFIDSTHPCGQTPTQNLQCTVTNPFYGQPNVTGTLGTATKISKLALLQQYPEYSSVTQQLVPGASANFHELLARLHLRTDHGLTFNANYEFSRNLITSQMNAGETRLVYGESTSDYPHHFSFTGSYDLPFGRGKKWLNHGGLADALVGGFKVNTLYQFLSGTPIQWGNVDFANGSAGFQQNFQLQPRNFAKAFNTAAFYTGTGTGYAACLKGTAGADCTDTGQPSGTYNYRTFPQYFFRSDFTNNLDASVIKGFHVKERLSIEYRFEAFNVLNHTQFGTPNVSPTSAAFGTINTIASVNRTLQQGLRVQF